MSIRISLLSMLKRLRTDLGVGFLFTLAPFVSVFFALVAFASIPFVLVFYVFGLYATYVASYTSPTNADPCLDQGGLDQNIYGDTTP